MTETELQSLISERVVRYSELHPQTNSFLDRRTPGNIGQETFSVIGSGVIENKSSQSVHISIPHGFCMGGARLKPGCANSQHSHETAETFIVHKGTFTFRLGPNCEDGDLELTEGDVISIPIHVFRGFKNTGNETGHLASVIGGDDPGQVVWAPYVFREAEKYGLVLLENGTLIDTVAGEKVPEGARLFPSTTDEDVNALKRLTASGMAGWFAKNDDLRNNPDSPLSGDGVQEMPVIGVSNPAENMPPGPISAPHGFQIRRIRMNSGSIIPFHTRNQVEVVFVHRGSATITINNSEIDLNQGDYFSLPIGEFRCWMNNGKETNELHVVHGGDYPEAPAWQ